MCAIIGSFDRERFHFLTELNSYRGNHSYSLAWLTGDSQLRKLERGFGAIPTSFAFPTETYLLGHAQAPTSAISLEAKNIHPAQNGARYLWHNGILKANTIRFLQRSLENPTEWDTQLLLDYLAKGGDLSQIDGSFACVYLSESGLFLFRNELAPLFYHPENFDLSSNYFAHSLPLEPNQIWRVDLSLRRLEGQVRFKTCENPYYFS